METSAPQTTKVIKRYANRKLYDTERSCYVTLEEISSMIKRGEEVRVVDNKSGEDLSAVTLAQIIFEEEKKKSKMPLSFLRNIIQSSSETIGGFISEKVAPTLEKMSSEWEKSTSRKDKAGDEIKEEPVSDESDSRHVLQSFVKNSQRVFDDIQKKVDERVRDTMGTASHFTTMGKDFETLRLRVEALEKKLQALLQR